MPCILSLVISSNPKADCRQIAAIGDLDIFGNISELVWWYIRRFVEFDKL